MRFLLSLLLVVSAVLSVVGQARSEYTIIPKPAHLEPRPGRFIVSPATTLMVSTDDPDVKAIAETFVNQILTVSQIRIPLQTGSPSAPVVAGAIVFRPASEATLGNEGYRLQIQPDRVLVEASKPAGFFYAVQTMLQLLPPAVYADKPQPNVDWSMPACRIVDKPRYAYRGLHLDVSRHFMPAAFVKKYIDLMARHKLNRFHWHLTDDQGWRIEIKKYPKLTGIGSRRKETLVGHYEEFDPRQFDGKPYGGFYTQDEIRDVVRYAAARQVMIIPEIEMPGHSLAALAAYPEYGCGPGPYEVATKWGIFEDILCPYEKTFLFLQDILTEVIDLFPGPYIHIGGDEAPKAAWRKSAYVQSLMKRLGLKTENQLQRHFINRIDRWAASKGRKIIGWDDILEGAGSTTGLTPGVTVMSWRGVKGGLMAARAGHDAIMTPATHVYLDHYQSDAAQEPTAFGGFTPLEKVYSYDPTPDDLPASAQKHIIGAQANVWTEYIPTPEQVEYMAWPRAAALAEVVWTPPTEKDWGDFSRRLPAHFRRLDQLSVNYSRAFYDVLTETDALPDGSLQVSLVTGAPQTEIRYTTNGSEPTATSTRYQTPLRLREPGVLRAVAVQSGREVGKPQQWNFLIARATGKPVRLSPAPTQPRGASADLLTDARTATLKAYSAEMRGVVGVKTDFNATIDLETVQSVQQVVVGFVRSTGHGIFLPRQITVAVSDDGQTFRTVGTLTPDPLQRGRREVIRHTLTFDPTHARYVRVTGRSIGKIPTGLPRAGQTAAILADEIQVK